MIPFPEKKNDPLLPINLIFPNSALLESVGITGKENQIPLVQGKSGEKIMGGINLKLSLLFPPSGTYQVGHEH